MLLDVRGTLRTVRRHPGFFTVAMATLGVGIGAAALVFSLVHTTLIRSLPFEDPDSLVWMYNARTERDRAPFSIPDLDDYRAANTTLAGFAVFTNWSANLTGAGAPERLEGTRVSGGFFPLLGAKALLGRTFEPRDEDGDARVALLTFGLWRRRFGADPSIIGRDISLNAARYTVIGVLPPEFLFPFREAEIAVPTTLRTDPRRGDRGANFLRVVARLAPGVTLRRAKADLDAIAHRLQRQYPDEDSRKTGVNLYPLQNEIMRDYRQVLWTLFAAVALFLLIGCGNLANLMFVRSIERGPELAIRTSLGASRARIVRQLGAEAVVIAAGAGIVGVALAHLGVWSWRIFGPASFPHRDVVDVDGAVLAFALSVSLIAALVCAVIPARAAGRDPGSAMSAARTMTGSRRQNRIRRAFVALQVGGAAVLLVCMGLVARGFAKLERVDAGFTPDHALSVQLSLPPRAYRDRAGIERFYDLLRARLAGVAEIKAVGAVSLRPLSGLLSTMDVAFPGRPAPPPDEVPQAHFRIATAGYFSAAGVRVFAGREFTDDDRAGKQPVAVVSRTFAERHWPNERAIGRTVQIAQGADAPQLSVVGVVSDVKQFGLDGAPTADLYVPLPQMPASQAALVASRMYWVFRTNGDPRLIERTVREAVRSTDADVASSSVQTLDEIVDASIAAWRVNVRLLEIFGQLAVLLCAVGVYAVAAYSATARRRELAIRSAFGGKRADLIALMLRDELRPVVAGLAAGILAATFIAPQLGSLLFHTSPWEPWIYAAVSAALLVTAIAATYLPTRRICGRDGFRFEVLGSGFKV